MNVLVCGGRNFNEYHLFGVAMNGVPGNVDLIVQGGARGADSLAKRWAVDNKIHCCEVKPLWEQFGKPAGHLRNAAMLKLKIDYCVAFPGGRGTADMVNKCKRANIPVYLPYPGYGEGVINA